MRPPGWHSANGLDVDLVSDGHAPATAGDPDAGLTAEPVVAHHNTVLRHAIHPGKRLRLVAAAEVFTNQGPARSEHLSSIEDPVAGCC